MACVAGNKGRQEGAEADNILSIALKKSLISNGLERNATAESFPAMSPILLSFELIMYGRLSNSLMCFSVCRSILQSAK